MNSTTNERQFFPGLHKWKREEVLLMDPEKEVWKKLASPLCCCFAENNEALEKPQKKMHSIAIQLDHY